MQRVSMGIARSSAETHPCFQVVEWKSEGFDLPVELCEVVVFGEAKAPWRVGHNSVKDRLPLESPAVVGVRSRFKIEYLVPKAGLGSNPQHFESPTFRIPNISNPQHFVVATRCIQYAQRTWNVLTDKEISPRLGYRVMAREVNRPSCPVHVVEHQKLYKGS
jgi:hypothetical protein